MLNYHPGNQIKECYYDYVCQERLVFLWLIKSYLRAVALGRKGSDIAFSTCILGTKQRKTWRNFTKEESSGCHDLVILLGQNAEFGHLDWQHWAMICNNIPLLNMCNAVYQVLGLSKQTQEAMLENVIALEDAALVHKYPVSEKAKTYLGLGVGSFYYNKRTLSSLISYSRNGPTTPKGGLNLYGAFAKEYFIFNGFIDRIWNDAFGEYSRLQDEAKQKVDGFLNERLYEVHQMDPQFKNMLQDYQTDLSVRPHIQHFDVTTRIQSLKDFIKALMAEVQRLRDADDATDSMAVKSDRSLSEAVETRKEETSVLQSNSSESEAPDDYGDLFQDLI